MNTGTVRFFSENIKFSLSSPKKITRWIKKTIQAESNRLSLLNIIFCNDAYLLSINEQYLNHHDYTDIITFNYSEKASIIEGDIFISIERVKDNALAFDISLELELQRVIIHGVLHLLGYNDKSKSEQQTMREKENSYLSLYYE